MFVKNNLQELLASLKKKKDNDNIIMISLEFKNSFKSFDCYQIYQSQYQLIKKNFFFCKFKSFLKKITLFFLMPNAKFNYYNKTKTKKLHI